MKKKTSIHIGSGKTGTSSIQSALFENEKKGEDFLDIQLFMEKDIVLSKFFSKAISESQGGLKLNLRKRGGVRN